MSSRPTQLTASWPPNYIDVWEWRQRQLRLFIADPRLGVGARVYYSTRCEEFVSDWCNTYDPRNAGTDTPANMPFVLFDRQRDMIQFILACLEGEASGLIEKCRDMGATWIACAVSVWLWLFWDGVSVGWGSRKEQLVDKLGDPDSIFEKMRMIIAGLPRAFLPAAFSEVDHMTYMRIINPETMATITGESGDNIGRGGRKRIYFKDESDHYEHPEKIEAALGDNTRCQIDMSSVAGPGTIFARKRESGVDWAPGQKVVRELTNVLILDWRDHPAKSQAWYDQRKSKYRAEGLLHVFAQEVDRNRSASVDGVVVPGEWVSAAIDAHVVLGIKDDGGYVAALDVADGMDGIIDTNALAIRKGIILKSVDEWGERDTGMTARRAVAACRELGRVELQYDSIGVGSGVKAETNRLRDEKLLPRGLTLVPWNAGDSVVNPERRVIAGDKSSPTNEELFTNLKAQAWMAFRKRFETTYRAVRSKASDATREEKKFTWDEDDLISLSSAIPLVRKLQKELSQATMGRGTKMKLLINKTPEGTKSPNLADAVMMCFFPLRSRAPMIISDEMVARSAAR